MMDRVKTQNQLMTYFSYHQHERRQSKAEKSKKTHSHSVKRVA